MSGEAIEVVVGTGRLPLVDGRARATMAALQLRIAREHQLVGAHAPALEAIEKTHAEQVGLHLPALYDEGRHRFLDEVADGETVCLLYTSPSPRDRTRSRMPSSA